MTLKILPKENGDLTYTYTHKNMKIIIDGQITCKPQNKTNLINNS